MLCLISCVVFLVLLLFLLVKKRAQEKKLVRSNFGSRSIYLSIHLGGAQAMATNNVKTKCDNRKQVTR